MPPPKKKMKSAGATTLYGLFPKFAFESYLQSEQWSNKKNKSIKGGSAKGGGWRWRQTLPDTCHLPTLNTGTSLKEKIRRRHKN